MKNISALFGLLLTTSSVLAQNEHHLMETMRFDTANTGCDLILSGVFVLNCPDQNLVFQTGNYIKYGNKGVKDYGTSYRLTSVHKIVEKFH